MIFSILLWGSFAVGALIVFYDQYANYVAFGAGGTPVLGRLITVRGSGNSYSSKATVLFAVSQKSCPGRDVLTQVADSIVAMLQQRDFNDMPEVMDFLNSLNQPWQESSRHRVPNLFSGGVELYVADVELQRRLSHPTFEEHGFVVISKTGKRRGKVFQLPWQSRHAQKIFSGV